MILSKAPLRVSFFGGGSDIPTFYEKHGGSTLSTTIDKYVYVSVMYTPKRHIKVSYTQQEIVKRPEDIKHDIVRNVLLFFGVRSNIEITTFADIPTTGSGLGGSSAFTCAMVVAVARYLGRELNRYQIADAACHVEIEMCGWKIGKQDQYASAFGGLNYIEYSQSGVDVSSTRLEYDLSEYILLVPTEIPSSHSSTLLESIDFNKSTELLTSMTKTAMAYRHSLPEHRELGMILDKAWQKKKQMTIGVSSPDIDHLMDELHNYGMIGGKLLGAGGGGYVLAVVESQLARQSIIHEFDAIEIKPTQDGARIVYED